VKCKQRSIRDTQFDTDAAEDNAEPDHPHRNYDIHRGHLDGKSHSGQAGVVHGNLGICSRYSPRFRAASLQNDYRAPLEKRMITAFKDGIAQSQ